MIVVGFSITLKGSAAHFGRRFFAKGGWPGCAPGGAAPKDRVVIRLNTTRLRGKVTRAGFLEHAQWLVTGVRLSGMTESTVNSTKGQT